MLRLAAHKNGNDPQIGYLDTNGKLFHVNPSYPGEKPYYKTIQSAITAATSGTTIIVEPGTYTENLVLKDGVNLHFMQGTVHYPDTTPTRPIYSIAGTDVELMITGYGEFLGSYQDPYRQFGFEGNCNVYLEAKTIGSISEEFSGISHGDIDASNPASGKLDLNVGFLSFLSIASATTSAQVELVGRVDTLNTINIDDIDLRGTVSIGNLSAMSFTSGQVTSHQPFRYVLEVDRFSTGSLPSIVTGYTNLHFIAHRWDHTPSVAGEARLELAGNAKLMLTTNAQSNISGAEGPFLNITSDFIEMIYSGCVLETGFTHHTIGTTATPLISLNSYGNKPIPPPMNYVPALAMTENVNVRA